jgi:hypothetical protein
MWRRRGIAATAWLLRDARDSSTLSWPAKAGERPKERGHPVRRSESAMMNHAFDGRDYWITRFRG